MVSHSSETQFREPGARKELRGGEFEKGEEEADSSGGVDTEGDGHGVEKERPSLLAEEVREGLAATGALAHMDCSLQQAAKLPEFSSSSSLVSSLMVKSKRGERSSRSSSTSCSSAATPSRGKSLARRSAG